MGRRLVAALVVLAATAAGCGGDGDASGSSATTASTTTTTAVPRYEEKVFDDVTVTSDIAYGTDPAMTLDIYEPQGDTETSRPLVVFVHGGSFRGGDKTEGVSPIMARTFAELGYVAASINYRLLATVGCTGNETGSSDTGCVAAAVEGIKDGQAAISFLRAHAADYGVDPDRIGIGGESAGGVVATAVGTWPGDATNRVQAWQSLSGGLPNVNFIEAGDAPGLLFHGTSDSIVPYGWSKGTDDALKKAGVPEELVTYEGAGHVPFREQRDDIIAKTIEWFGRYVANVS